MLPGPRTRNLWTMLGVAEAKEQNALGPRLVHVHVHDRIRALAEKLRGRALEANVEQHLQVGALIVNDLYGGKLGAWRKRRKKDPSLRTLSQALSGALSASSLYDALSVHEVQHHLGSHQALPSLSVRARVTLARVPEDRRLEILDRAVAKARARSRDARTSAHPSVTASDIAELVRELPKRSRGGRPKTNPTLKALRQCLAVLSKLDQTGGDIANPGVRRECAELVQEVSRVLRRISVDREVGVFEMRNRRKCAEVREKNSQPLCAMSHRSGTAAE